MKEDENIMGGRLSTCSLSPLTGYRRNGKCQSPNGDIGVHGVCSQVTEEFLNFTKNRGNDLSTPNQMAGFPGLRPGDRWCLCASRWREALENNVAPPIILEATGKNVLKFVSLEDLSRFALNET